MEAATGDAGEEMELVDGGDMEVGRHRRWRGGGLGDGGETGPAATGVGGDGNQEELRRGTGGGRER